MRISPMIAARLAAALTIMVLTSPAVAAQRADVVSLGPSSLPSTTSTSSQSQDAITQAALRAMPSALRRQLAPQDSPPSPKPSAYAKEPSYAGFYRLATGGFGEPNNAYSWSMEFFKGRLYVGTSRNNLCNETITLKSTWARQVTGCPLPRDYLNLDMRAEIWAFTPGPNTWQMVYQSPMVNDSIEGSVSRVARDAGYRSMATYTDRYGITALYVGSVGFGDLAVLVRTIDGVHFSTVGTPGLGIGATSIRAITPFAGRLFVAPIGTGTTYTSGVNRDTVLMSDNPAGGKWTEASHTGFGDAGNAELYTMSVFDGQLYAAISNNRGYQIWRTNAIGKAPYSWTLVVVNGAYRGNDSPSVTTMTVFNNQLYVGSAAETVQADGQHAKGCELIAINPDDTWNLVVGDARQTPEGYKAPTSGLSPGFGNPYNVYLWRLATHDGWLYAGTYNYGTFTLAQHPKAAGQVGFDLWKSQDGRHWQQVSTNGFGNPYSYGVRSLVDTPLGLFLGTADPFANAPDGRGGTQVWLLPSPDGLDHPHGVTLSTSGCPMAHCSPQIDGAENIDVPTNGAYSAWQFTQRRVGFSTSLGCSTGQYLVVCAGTNLQTDKNAFDSAYVHAFDLQGHVLWDSRRLLDQFVAGGVPLIDSQDNSYLSDNYSIVSFSPEGVVRWRVPNPANMVVVSFNLLPSGWLVGQAGIGLGRSLVMVINPQTGAVASNLDLAATLNGSPGDWATANTVAVVGNRLYTVTQLQSFSKSGANNELDPLNHARIYAIDIDANGHLHVAWHFDFQGPTGGSPLVIPGPHTIIYDDGTGLHPGDPQHVMLFGIEDMGTRPNLLWANDLTQSYGVPYPSNAVAPGIQAAPAHDPRGGVWVWSRFDHRVFRFDELTGAHMESLSIPDLTGDPGAYPDATIDIAANDGNPVMFIGVLGGVQHPNKVAAIDLNSDKLLWAQSVGTGAEAAPYGQFPLAVTGAGHVVLIAPISDGTTRGFVLY